jgi:hypothetical protein
MSVPQSTTNSHTQAFNHGTLELLSIFVTELKGRIPDDQTGEVEVKMDGIWAEVVHKTSNHDPYVNEFVRI